MEGPDGACVIPNPCEPNPCTQPNKTICSVSDGQAVCACVSGYVPEGDGCKPEQTITCEGQHSTGDAFEPDECPALARSIGAGGTQNEEHTLSPVGDEDWLKLPVVAGHLYEAIATGAAGQTLDLDLYAADGTTVLASDHRGQTVAKILHKAAGSGQLFFRIHAFVSGESGAYTLSIVDLGVDDFADEPEFATRLTAPNGTPVSGALQFDGDRDVVKLSLVAGHSYRFEAAWSATSTAPLQLDLIAPDKTTVVLSRQQVAPQALTRITSAGDYFLRIQEPSGTLRAGYTFTFTDLGVDDFGDGPSDSSPVTIGSPPANGAFERPDDVDVFTFQAQAGHIYAFTCNPSGGATDCLVSLSDATGNVLATDNNGGTGSIIYEYDQAGTYFFRLSSGKVGSYTYRLEDQGLDDHGDTFATATAIAPLSTATNARLETAGDADFFSFSGSVSTTYEFSCTSTAVDCNVVLHDSNGTVVQTDAGSSTNARVTYLVRTAGTFYLKVYNGTATVGAYTYQLKNLGTDDHGNTPADATPVTPAAVTVNARLNASWDVDVFSFEAVAGHIYEVFCSASGYSLDLVLMDAAGTVIASDAGSIASLRAELNTAGTYYFRLKSTTSTVGAYTYRLEDVGVDDHGDTLATATPITPSATNINATFEVPRDEDWFSFTATAGHVYDFTCDPRFYACNVYLLDASGAVLVSKTSTTNSATTVRWEIATSGTYYARAVTDVYGDDTYTYRLQDLGLEDHGDTMATATPLTPSATNNTARFEIQGDVDWFSFTAEVGHVYDFTFDAFLVDGNVSLLDATGTVLATSTSGLNAAKVRWEMATAGTYYVRVTVTDWYTSDDTYNYRLQDLGLDDHGDTRATATPITPSTTSSNARFEVTGDEDWFSFTATAGHIYDFACNPSSANCDVYLMDSTGAVLVSDTSTLRSASVRWEIANAGTYYLRAVVTTWAATDAYTYQLQDLGLDDHADSISGATVLTLGTATAGKIETTGDVDVFAVTLAANTSYTVSTTGISTSLRVYAPDGTTVIVSGSSPRTFTSVAGGGTHYVQVTGASGTGSYTVRVQ
ncbi:PPC domain-containing protein [Hyalangium versicolor]|uniref:PPC domain-containing protein n=1 Tax=Hyalangium versicolor TaxID=2861190 RepID=UPI001CCB966D|nr:PPC domain-containing protein [Hyalangium versicolor]